MNMKIHQKTVVEQVMDKIKYLIASGEYKPGNKIPTELELAETFGVGRSSIREAIKIFNYLGVLKSKTAKGTYVMERSHISTEALSWTLLLGSDELEEMIDLRGSIELWSILALSRKFAAGHDSAVETINTLRGIVTEMQESVSTGKYKELVNADFTFHLEIIKSQDNPQFISLYHTLRSFLYAEIEGSQDTYSDPALIPAEHNQIVLAIESGNQQTVLETYTGHIINTKSRVQENLQRHTKV